MPKSTSSQEGRLRGLLVSAARSLLDEPEEALDLRKVAERAGKSRTAPYLVFGKTDEGGGLAALRLAVATGGFQEIAAEMEEAFRACGDPEEGFLELVASYIRYARMNRRLFLLMFDREVVEASYELVPPGPGQEERDAFQAARAQVEHTFRLALDSQATGFVRRPRSGDTDSVIGLIWAMIHGMASLALNEPWDIWADPETTAHDLAARALEMLTFLEARELDAAALALGHARDERPLPTRDDFTGPAVPGDSIGLNPQTLDEEPPGPAHAALRESSALRRARYVRDVLLGARVLWLSTDGQPNLPELGILDELGVDVSEENERGDPAERFTGHLPHVVIAQVEDVSDWTPGTNARWYAPVILYLDSPAEEPVAVPDVFGITADPEELLHLILDVFERRRM